MTTTEPIQILWEDPPQGRGGRPSHGRYEPVVEQLRTKPGKWAVVSEAPADKISRLDSPRKKLKELGAEAITRTVVQDDESRVARLYARWPE